MTCRLGWSGPQPVGTLIPAAAGWPAPTLRAVHPRAGAAPSGCLHRFGGYPGVAAASGKIWGGTGRLENRCRASPWPGGAFRMACIDYLGAGASGKARSRSGGERWCGENRLEKGGRARAGGASCSGRAREGGKGGRGRTARGGYGSRRAGPIFVLA